MRRWIFALAIGGILTACSTNQPKWESRVGVYTFDMAVKELGAPDRNAALTDGSRVAEYFRAPISEIPVVYCRITIDCRGWPIMKSLNCERFTRNRLL